MNETFSLPSMDRLRWHCRRGMLELDCVFEQFLDEKYESQDQQTKRLFVRLLEVQDPELNDWIMNGNLPDDPEMRRIVQLVRGI